MSVKCKNAKMRKYEKLKLKLNGKVAKMKDKKVLYDYALGNEKLVQ